MKIINAVTSQLGLETDGRDFNQHNHSITDFTMLQPTPITVIRIIGCE